MIDLDFKGERVVLGKVEPELELEHLARYRLAGQFVHDAAVLDFGCGTGYGADILKRAGARRVVGSDQSTQAVLYAQDNYAGPSVHFCATDCERSAFADDCFDVVVSFELIEHLENYNAFVRDVRRILKPTGRFIVSTPNKRTYTDESQTEPNSFHVHEFYLDELRALLSRQFGAVAILGQSLTEGTLFHGEGKPDATGARSGSRRPLISNSDDSAMKKADFFVAVCAHDESRLGGVAEEGIFHLEQTNALRARKRRIFDLQAELEDRTRWAKDLEGESSRRGRHILELQTELTERTTWAQDLAQEGESRGRRILELQGELEERLRWATQLEKDRTERDQRIAELKRELAMAAESAQRVSDLRSELLGHTTAIEEQLASQQILSRDRHEVHRNELSQQTQHWEYARETLTTLTTSLDFLDEQAHESTETLGKRLRATRGIVQWQRDTLIRHQDDLEQHDVSLVALDKLLSQLGKQMPTHSSALDSLRQVASRHEQSLNRYDQHLAMLSERLDTAFKRTADQAEIMWGSLPWRAWSKLGRILDALPWRRARARRAAQIAAADPTSEPSATPVAAAPESTLQPRALVLDHRMPTPSHDAGSVRTIALLELLQAQGYAVTFLPANLFAWEPFYSELLRTGVEIITTPEYASLTDYLDQHGSTFELAFVARFHIAKDHIVAVRAACPDALLIFDTVDLQYLRLERQAALEKDTAKRAEAERLRHAELGVARQADITLVVSDAELTMLNEAAPELDVRVVSLIHDIEPIETPFEARKDFFFIGGFEHPPNLDAATWFVREVFPSVREALPEVRVLLIGSKAPPSLQELAGNGVEIIGYVDDVDPYLSGCRLSIAPLRYGAGVKGKVTQSLSSGLPCVMTSIAAEGIGLVDQRDALIADDSEAFAAAVITLYQDRDLWQRLARAGVDRMRERFSRAVAEEQLVALIDHARERRRG